MTTPVPMKWIRPTAVQGKDPGAEMTRRIAYLALAIAAIAAPVTSGAIDGADVETVFAVRKNTNGNRVDYGVRLDAQCRPIGDEPVFSYFRRTEGSIRSLSFLERTVYGTRGQRVRREDAGGGRVDFRLRPLPERTVRVVARQANGRCAASAITRIDGQTAVITDVYVVLSSPRRVHHIEVTGRTIAGSNTVREELHDD